MDKMRRYKSTILCFLSLFLIFACKISAAENITPCTIKALIDLKGKAIDSLTDNEFELLMELQESCFQYNISSKTGLTPCDDRLFKWLKEQKLEHLSSNQIKYLAKMNQTCNNYKSSKKRESEFKEKLPAIIVGGSLAISAILFLTIALPIILIHNSMENI